MGTVFSHVFNLGFASLSLLPLIALYPDSFKVSLAMLLLPLVIALLVVLGLGLTLITSILNVVYRDVGYIVNSLLLVLFWATPIVYSSDKVTGTAKTVMMLNPMASLIDCVRTIVMQGVAPSLRELGIAASSTAVVLAVGVVIYRSFATVVSDHV